MLLPMIGMIPVGIYLYFYFKRIFKCFHKNTDSRILKVLLAAASFLIVLPAINIWSVNTVIVLHFFAFSVCTDLIILIGKRLAKKNLPAIWNKLYQCGLFPILCTALLLCYGWWNMTHPVETSYTVYTDKNIRQEGYQIALLSDLHFGTTMGMEKLKTYCDQISDNDPDLVILCGDIIDENTTRSQMQAVFPQLASIKSTYGVFFVYGNHDRGRYSSEKHFTEGQLEEVLRGSGIHVLSDETYTVNEELTLIGREDRSFYRDTRKTSEALLESVDTDNFLLMLDHQPRELIENDEVLYDLQLSGHTHGGQIFPVGLFSDLFARFGEMNYGYRQMDHMQVIVSSGIGGWGYPIRTGSHSEYVLIDLKPQSY